MSSINSKQANSEEWISISDLMAGLMFLFLLIAVWFMSQAQKKHELVDQVLDGYVTVREDIVRDLTREFQDDVEKWNIVIDSLQLSVRFQQPEVLFEPGEADLRGEFESILSDFFPRYVNVLRPYERQIRELRIEGHTSSDWKDKSGFEAYKENMRLSQDRTRSVLTFLADLSPVRQMWDSWLKASLTANGLSSSRPILLAETGDEDASQSRRVEFRVEIDAGALLDSIIEGIKVTSLSQEAIS
jgi:outer membrane protein OmpA-like peptidoglycan-associated protein